MSESVTRCEVALLQTVHLMHACLRDAIVLAPACTVTAEEALAVDSAAMELERQRAAERQRILLMVRRLDGQFQELAQVIGACLHDVPLAAMDAEIEALNEENLQLADHIMEAYDEAAQLAAKIEERVHTVQVPNA